MFAGRTSPATRSASRPAWVLFVALLALGSVGRVPAAPEERPGEVLYPLIFPLLGQHTLTTSFGDPRGTKRSHSGVDILAEKGTPVLAVADAEVRWVHDGTQNKCCDVALLHDDGWRSRYIHLDNDTPGTDDGRAVGIAPGVTKGARVVAGQVIGWVGDSGNAEETVPHLHFELRRPDGTPVDPYPSLLAARHTVEDLTPPAVARRRNLELEAGKRQPPLLGFGRRPGTAPAPAPRRAEREIAEADEPTGPIEPHRRERLRGWGWSCARFDNGAA